MSELGAVSAEVLAQLRYDLPASYSFHRCRQSRCGADRFGITTSTDWSSATQRSRHATVVRTMDAPLCCLVTGRRIGQPCVTRCATDYWSVSLQAEVAGHRGGPLAVSGRVEQQ